MVSHPRVTIKTHEFKLYPNQSQVKKIERWLSLQCWVWNRGLALIEWREWLEKWDRVLNSGVDLDGVEPVPLRWHLNPDKKAAKADKWLLACDRVKWRRYDPQTDIEGWQGDDDHWRNPMTGEWRERSNDGKGFIVAMPGYELVKEHWLNDCPLQQVRSNPFFDLLAQFSVGNWKHKLGDCPAKFVAGTCKSLADSWKAYKSGIRDRPRYKGRTRKVESLIHPNSKGSVRIAAGKINIPKLGWVTVRGLDGRWDGQEFCPMKVCKKGNEYYLQLTYEAPIKQVPSRDARVIGIDPGGKVLAADDHGHQFPPCDVSRLLQRIANLQQKASRQYRANRTEIKDGDRVIRHETDPNWKRKNLNKTYRAIGRLHERIRRKRLAHAHFVADRIVSMADIIVFEQVQWTNLSRQNADQLDEKGNFKHNRARSKSGLNKVMVEASPGLLRRLIQEKAKERDRVLLLCPSINGFSGVCSDCGHDHHRAKQDKNLWRPTRNLFHCQSCGRLAHSDTNAARNLKQWGEQLVREQADVSAYLPANQEKRSTRKGSKKKTA